MSRRRSDILTRAAPLFIAALLCFIAATAPSSAAGEDSAGEIVLWHAYRGEEQKAFEKTVAMAEQSLGDVKIRTLSVPFEVYTNKITNAIPRGHGPDLFVFAHELIGDWAKSGLVEPVGACDDAWLKENFLPETLAPLCRGGRLWAYPVAFKSLALFYNTDMVPEPPETTDELIALARKHVSLAGSACGLVFLTGEFYPIFPFFSGFGGGIKSADGSYNLATDENARALAFIKDLVVKDKIVPEEVTGALVTQFFSSGQVPFAINGPWFVGEIKDKVPFGIHPLPVVSETGKRMKPFLTVEGIFLSAYGANKEKAKEVARLLVKDRSAAVRFEEGFQCVANSGIGARMKKGRDAENILRGFYSQLPHTLPMPNDPEMRSVWVPAKHAVGKVLRGQASPKQALADAQRLFLIYTAPPPERSEPLPYILIAGLVLLAAAALLVRKARKEDIVGQVRKARAIYVYLLPGMLATAGLVFLPFLVGASVSLFSHVEGQFTFVGLRNFANILFSSEFGVFEPMNFYTTLIVTVLWTAANVTLHVSMGIGIALMLERPWAVLRPVYRILLIIPWAIPNYITALIWKGMFHKQLGTINAILDVLGVEPVSWFSKFATAFSANLITNTWLGFPFMMVVTLGALQAIPKDIEESAKVDGAGAWTIFWKIKFPLLKPALLPAVLLGTIWTFNMFNIIYLVSGGEPGGATDILISEAYRWAFERHERYGYAAAYAVLIFVILLIFSMVQSRMLKTKQHV